MSITTFGTCFIIVVAASIFEFGVFEKRIFPKYIPKLIELVKKYVVCMG